MSAPPIRNNHHYAEHQRNPDHERKQIHFFRMQHQDHAMPMAIASQSQVYEILAFIGDRPLPQHCLQVLPQRPITLAIFAKPGLLAIAIRHCGGLVLHPEKVSVSVHDRDLPGVRRNDAYSDWRADMPR